MMTHRYFNTAIRTFCGLAVMVLLGYAAGASDNQKHDDGQRGHQDHDAGERGHHDDDAGERGHHDDDAGERGHQDHDDGSLIEVGKHEAHLRITHDAAKGSVTIVVLGRDGKTPLKPDEAPRINISAQGQRRQITAALVADAANEATFAATDAGLKGHVHGRIRLKVGGKTFQVPLPDPHH